MAEALSSDKYAAQVKAYAAPPAAPTAPDSGPLTAATLGPATPAAAMEVLAYVAATRPAVAALEAESATAAAALASGPADLRRAEELRDQVASGAAELASARARTQDQVDRVNALRARRDALARAKP